MGGNGVNIDKPKVNSKLKHINMMEQGESSNQSSQTPIARTKSHDPLALDSYNKMGFDMKPQTRRITLKELEAHMKTYNLYVDLNNVPALGGMASFYPELSPKDNLILLRNGVNEKLTAKVAKMFFKSMPDR